MKAAKELALRVSDLEVKDRNGMPALSFAAKFSSIEMFKTVLNGGASVLTKGAFGRSLFHSAIMYGNRPMAGNLLTTFFLFTVHDRDSHGNQSLHLVALKGQQKSSAVAHPPGSRGGWNWFRR
jgi:ankyrin repeat protein